MATLNTMEDLYTFLSNSTYDVTIILIAYPFTKPLVYIPQLIASQYAILKKNPYYFITYQYLVITAPKITEFYLANVTTSIPYLVTYKNKYLSRIPWWYPCKQVSATSPIDDINVFIKYSIMPLQGQNAQTTRVYDPFTYTSARITFN